MKKAFWCAVVFLPIVLAACCPHPRCADRSGLGQEFIVENFKAADALVGNATARIDPYGRVLVLSFTDRENISASPRFGRLVSAQFSSRLIQLGHMVFEADLPWEIGADNGFIPTTEQVRVLQRDFNAWALLAGTYTLDEETVFISAKLFRLSDGAVVGAHEYSLPRKGIVARLLDDPDRYDRILEAHMRSQPARTPGVLITPPTRLKEGDAAPDQGGVFRLFPPERLNE